MARKRLFGKPRFRSGLNNALSNRAALNELKPFSTKHRPSLERSINEIEEAVRLETKKRKKIGVQRRLIAGPKSNWRLVRRKIPHPVKNFRLKRALHVEAQNKKEAVGALQKLRKFKREGRVRVLMNSQGGISVREAPDPKKFSTLKPAEYIYPRPESYARGVVDLRLEANKRIRAARAAQNRVRALRGKKPLNKKVKPV